MVKQFWKFSRKITTLCWKTLEIFLTLFLIVGGLLLYHLHNNPVDAMKYIPEIEQAVFSSDSAYHLHAEKVELTSDWSRDGLIQIDILNLQILQGQKLVFSIPKAQFSYDLWHILTLNYLPSHLIVEKPFFEMIVDEKGLFSFKTDASSNELLDMNTVKKMVQRILAIRELNVTDAHFRIQDNRFKQKWDLQKANLVFERLFRFSNIAKLNATLVGEGVNSRFLATARMNRFSRLLTLESGLDTINLKRIASVLPILQEADLDVQLSLKGQFDMAKTHEKITDYISKVQFNVKTLKSGTLNLMGDLDNVYHVQSANINGTLGKGAKTLKIASSQVQLKDEKPADFYLDVAGIDTFLNTAKTQSLKTTLRAILYNVPTGHVPGLWPSKQGSDAHAWVQKNLSKGQINEAHFTLYFAEGKLTDLLGDIRAEGVRVDYLSPMKPVENVRAQVLLYPDKVHILADKGAIGDLSLESADLLFADVDKEETWLQIDLKVTGPIQQAIALISSKPLEFPQKFHLKPSLVSGQATTFVHLSFPLAENLKTDEVEAAVHADLTHVKVNDVLAYLGLKEGTLSLDVSNEGLEISGDVLMKNSPLQVKWHEYFDPKQTTSEYAVSGTLMATDIGALLPSIRSLLKGKIGVDFRGTKNTKNTYAGAVLFQADDAWVDLSPVDVQKKSGRPMIAQISFLDVTAKIGQLHWDIEGSLMEQSDDLKITGQADWTLDSLHVLLSSVVAGPNQFQGELKKTPQDFSLVLQGKNWQAYRLTELLSTLPTSDTTKMPPDRNMTLDIHLDQLAFNPNKPLKEVAMAGWRQGPLWKKFHFQGKAEDPFVIAYNPKKAQFQGSFADLGDLMERLNFVGRFGGGKVSFIADQKSSGMIDGQIKVESAQLKETGFLMQAVTILGIVDAFRGKDMEFDEIEIPFQLSPDFRLMLSDAYAVGTNLGITFKGEISLNGLDLSGSVVPAYALNSLPGKIPVLGWLFRNGEGGGLINVPYTVTGSLFSPEIEWSPLKTVAPGALGRLF